MAEIIAILKVIPALIDLFDKLAALYVSHRIGQMNKAVEDGIRVAITNQDQRKLEEAIGADAGQPSGITGTTERDSLPGVK